MTPDQLRKYGEALFGDRWQTPVARLLGMKDAAEVRKWLRGPEKGRPIPEHVEPRLKPMLNLDHFIVGEGESGKEYIIHTRPPRFVATVHSEEGGDDDLGLDILSGLTYGCADGDATLCEFVWWDKPPEDESELRQLLRRADAAFEQIDMNVMARADNTI